MRDLAVPVVALSVRYHEGPDSTSESAQDVVVIPRSAVDVFISLLKALRAADGEPRLRVGWDDASVVSRCDWDQLVLDPTIVSLLKDDFESFFEREGWFRKMRLPFRRGYLLHGPPGNGKSTAIRAMMTSRGLTAYTIRFFDDKVDDEALERLFERAAQEAPAIVLLEDIDRSFPRTGPSKTKISLQQLLNCLDGIASGEGIITIATANEPTALDPAILRRPGRFDRVVLFADPTPELRREYFVRMHPAFADMNLDQAVEESAGFSFAQLREAFIMAAQADFQNNGKIDLDDLLNSIWSLRGSLLFGSMKPSAGFALPRPGKRGNHD
jgi:SpoVK/Ycf46/Vps4 family AAA+-type ATPase